MDVGRLHSKILETDGSTDAVYLPGISIVNHLDGSMYGNYSAPQGLAILIIDDGGNFETSNMDREKEKRHSERYEKEIIQSVSLINYGLKTNCLKYLAAGTTLSALVNNRLNPKSILRSCLNLVASGSALGFNTSHTGTVVGGLCYEKNLKPLLKRVVFKRINKSFFIRLEVCMNSYIDALHSSLKTLLLPR